MLDLKIKIESLNETIDAISALTKEAKIDFSSEGISTRAVDPANVAMVSMNLGKDAFEHYEVSNCELGIDLTKFSGILEMAPKGSIVELTLDEKTHKLKIKMVDLSFDMSLLDPSSIRKNPKIPDIEMPGNIVLKGEDFKLGIKASLKIAEYVTFMANETKFSMIADGDTDGVTYDVTKEQLVSLSITGKPEVKSLYSMDYLNDVMKCMGKKEVEIGLGMDFPVKLSFLICDGKGQVFYMIAPRVENNN